MAWKLWPDHTIEKVGEAYTRLRLPGCLRTWLLCEKTAMNPTALKIFFRAVFINKS